MVKHSYLIHVNTKEIDEADPNIQAMVQDIRWGIRTHGKEFTYSIRILINGFLESEYVNKAVTVFVSDLSNEGSAIYRLGNDNCADLISEFIKEVAYPGHKGDNYPFDGILVRGTPGLTIRFFLPKTLISEEKYEEFMGLGPDDLLAAITPDDAIRYFLPYLYECLYRLNLLDEEKYRDLWNYQIGLA